MRAANLDKGIEGRDFQYKKEQTLILYNLLNILKGLKEEQIRSLADAILVKRDKQKALGLLQSFTKEDKRWYAVPRGGSRSQVPQAEAMWRNAVKNASTITDLGFLSHLKTNQQPIVLGDLANDNSADCVKTAYDSLTTQLDSMVSGASQQILSIQREELNRQVQRALKSEEDDELKASRAEFVRRIEDRCRERSRS